MSYTSQTNATVDQASPMQDPHPNVAPSIHISLYAYGGVSAACLLSWISMAHAIATRPAQAADIRTVREDALISRSRSRATKWFLDSGKDVWVQVDHDIEFDPSDIYRIAQIAHDTGSTVCIPYSCRSLPPRPALRPKAEHLQTLKDMLSNADGAPETVPIQMFASGCLAIPRRSLVAALEGLQSPKVDYPYRIDWCKDTLAGEFPTLWMPFAVDTLPNQLEYLSEDYAAAFRLSLCEVEHLAYRPSKPLSHWGEFPFAFHAYAPR